MNKLILYLLLLIPATTFAQDPDPRLFDVSHWYLEKLTVADEDFFPPQNWEINHVVLSFYESTTPPIYWLEASVCNWLGEAIEFIGPDEFELEPPAMSATFCNLEENRLFEDFYFDFYAPQGQPLNPFSYSITEEPNNITSLVITNQNGDKAFYQNIPLAILDVSMIQTIMVPNPVHEGKTKISASAPINGIKVMDLHGRQISQIPLNGTQQYLLDLEQLTNGLYFVHLEFEGGTQITKKLILQK